MSTTSRHAECPSISRIKDKYSQLKRREGHKGEMFSLWMESGLFASRDGELANWWLIAATQVVTLSSFRPSETRNLRVYQSPPCPYPSPCQKLRNVMECVRAALVSSALYRNHQNNAFVCRVEDNDVPVYKAMSIYLGCRYTFCCTKKKKASRDTPDHVCKVCTEARCNGKRTDTGKGD